MPFPPLPGQPTSTEAGIDETEERVAESAEAQPDPEPIPAPQEEPPEPGQLYDWSGDGRSVSRIVIDTNEQKARFYAGEDQIGWTTIASGVASHPTPRGEFTILEKVRDKRSNLYGKIVNRNGQVIKGSAHGRDPVPAGARFVGASMPNFMRLTYDGIGLHAGPIPRPGSPASHGCIRMPAKFAATVFEHVDYGTAVTVVGDGPDYGNYGERIARQQAEERARRAAAAAAAEGTALDALDAEIEVMREAQANNDESSSPEPPEPSRSPAADTSGAAAGGDGNASDAADGRDRSSASAARSDQAGETGAGPRGATGTSASGTGTSADREPAADTRATESSTEDSGDERPTDRAEAPSQQTPATPAQPEQPAPGAVPAPAPGYAPPPYYTPPTPSVRSAGTPDEAMVAG